MAAAATTPVKYASRNYIIECALVMGFYVCAVWARPWLIARAANHALALAATVLPALPIWLMLAVVWRYYIHIDELERHKLLRTLSISFGIGSCALVTYAFLIDAGLPPLALSWAWPTLAVCWLLTHAVTAMLDHQ
jgi:hypothetical protein